MESRLYEHTGVIEYNIIFAHFDFFFIFFYFFATMLLFQRRWKPTTQLPIELRLLHSLMIIVIVQQGNPHSSFGALRRQVLVRPKTNH